ncbi:MAG: hydrogenase 4 subunit B, partial [Candidatus Competibacteraceae bacterium]|nr:hydrogenase 4 subunit B [Candidatus Competibacteraceae bacterium]
MLAKTRFQSMFLALVLLLLLVLLAAGGYGMVAPARSHGSRHVYGLSLAVCAVLLLLALAHLLAGREPRQLTLPLGLPWLGLHFRLDALSAFFMVVVNLGGAVASLFGLGYGAHERAPERVLPFY